MASRLEGEVISVRDTGDLVTDITSRQLDHVPRDDRLSVTCDGHTTMGIFSVDHQQPELTFLAVLSDADCLELCLVGENAADFLGIRVGSKVILKW